MRGEDDGIYLVGYQPLGSPPHARGRRLNDDLPFFVIADHPRMRGEDHHTVVVTRAQHGSPPHARGRPNTPTATFRCQGITPACAGKTGGSTLAVNSAADHPRMRGEDRALASPIVYLVGSPPHARGRPRPSMRCTPAAGITPACAGKTRRGRGSSGHFPDHPRMRGEDVVEKGELGVDAGSPPHARGRRYGSLRCAQLWGITPACAGKTGPRGPKQPN